MATADEWGWEFEAFEEEGHLAVVDLDPVEMANSLDNIRGNSPTSSRSSTPTASCWTPVSLLEMMYDDQARRRTEIFDFTRALKRAGVTTMLTSEASETNAYASRHGVIEYPHRRRLRAQVRPLGEPGDQTRRRNPEDPQREPLARDQTLRDNDGRHLGLRSRRIFFDSRARWSVRRHRLIGHQVRSQRAVIA